MAASGFAGLGYQIVWTRQLSLGLGHEAAAVLATITAFFGGLAVGAWALGRRIERSGHPLRWYAVCEAVVCAWGLVMAVLMTPACGWLLERVGERPAPGWQWAVSFFGSFLVLLPSTAAMGATLPAMERAMAAMARRGASIASLYAANTAGAVLGVVTAAFWLVPGLGLLRTAVACSVLNLLCAAAAAWLSSGGRMAPAGPASDAPRRSRLPSLLAATGLLGVGYEVLAVRVLSQVAEDTVYTFATLLAVYLVGTALGAAAYQRWDRGPGAVAFGARGAAGRRGGRLLLGLAAACLVGGLGLWNAEVLRAAATRLFGTGQPAALAAEAAVAVAAFLPPTLAMGAVFSALSSVAREEGIAFSRCLAVNTVGAALAPLLVGVVLLPLLGAKSVMVLIVLGYVALAAASAGAAAETGGLAAVALATAVLAPPLAFVDLPAGGRVLRYRDGAMAAVSVVEDAEGVRRLRIDNRAQEGSSATVLADARQALLPVLLHPAPRRALFLGLGTGITATAAAWDRSLQVDAVELLPEVIDASSLFLSDPDGAAAARLHVIAADARRFVRAAAQHYDVIVADNVHPARSGSAALYTAEHFRAVRSRLGPGGLFCQWLPLHQLDLDTLRSIVASFRSAFPEGWALLATHSLETPVIGLMARADGARFDARRIEERLRHAQLSRPPDAFGFHDTFALLGSFVAGPRSLARFSAGAPLNTDDRPVVAYLAPRITYAPDGPAADRLLALLRSLEIHASELLQDAAEPDRARRLEAYWRARDAFLEAGVGVRPSDDVRRMLSQVREPLLAALRTSPDFRPAYDPLLRMAGALARTDAEAGRALLQELAALQPQRPEASDGLQRLASPAP